MRNVTSYAPAETGEYPSDIAEFSNLRTLWKIFEG